MLNTFFELNINRIRKHNYRVKVNLIEKFDKLLVGRNTVDSFLKTNRSKWIVNISDQAIPDDSINILSLGDKFALPFNNQDKKDRLNLVLDTIKNFEYSFLNVSHDIVIDARNTIHNFIKNNLNFRQHIKAIDRYLISAFKSCTKFLKRLQTRIKEHFSDIKKKVDIQSVVSRHRLNSNHEFDWPNVKILHKEDNVKKREIAEMIFIKQNRDAINSQKDTDNLPSIYNNILKHM
ncbi:hypothetical protein X777_09799 [Ooceraea biroi]|uniref:Uncharacterized protein n=1 Tax=Ooceraea biroi TaxID=2015173 RepID=A0A026W905_OOCBI|nr:hypothetical protein X777_09799 [Ooceraea biroi]